MPARSASAPLLLLACREATSWRLDASGGILTVTDLGTALWYLGRPDDALAEFERSLAIEPSHSQTLFNMGIVRADGKHDPAGAVQAWEKLLASTPSYAAADKVRDLIKDAKTKIR